VTEEASIWPERRRTQGALFAVGGLLLSVVALALAGVVQLGGAYVVMIGTVASWILIYGLLGWGGQWVAGAEEDDAIATGDETGGVGDAETADAER